ncbi:hypothetical protein PIB30_116616 [Stylosanthes scabra]|uniref:Uncharacterized protein n=1 Tax=Stylosanthes scabra TaxID=79078 RepID=A0ABU6Z7M6_9FABA|nr:hypothetical protein [Stylosanthes scabra]
MNEYRLVDTITSPSRLKGSMRVRRFHNKYLCDSFFLYSLFTHHSMLVQLDDWVLCRVRHKGYSSKNSCENQDNPCEPNMLPNLPRGDEGYPTTDMNFQADVITDYQYKDYQILASILVGGHVPTTERGGNGPITSVHEDGLHKEDSYMTVSPLDCYFNTLKRKSNEDNQYENLISFNSKLNMETTMDESSIINRGLNCYNQNQSHGDITFNERAPEPSINFQEPNQSAFIGSYPQ